MRGRLTRGPRPIRHSSTWKEEPNRRDDRISQAEISVACSNALCAPPTACPQPPDDTPVTIAQSHPSLMPRAQKPAVRSMPPDSVIEEESQARIDRSIQPIEDEHVYHTDHALWVVEPGSETTLPDESAYTPPPVATISLGAEAVETGMVRRRKAGIAD